MDDVSLGGPRTQGSLPEAEMALALGPVIVRTAMVGGSRGRCRKMGRRAILFLASVALASAHPPGFESDVTEDGVISFCNPDGVRPGLFA
jgi:hypothetical protein